MHAPICGCWGAAIILFAVLPAAPQSPDWNAKSLSTAPQSAAIVSTQIRAISSAAGTYSETAFERTGDSYEGHRQYQAAIDAYSMVYPPTANVWNKMGVAYQMMYDAKDAARSYARALKMDPNSFSALNNLATVEDSLGDYSEAERFCRKGLELSPRSATLLKNLGTTLLLQHDYRGGADAYAEAMAIDPHIFDNRPVFIVRIAAPHSEHGTTEYYQARVCARGGQSDCAVFHLRRAFDAGSANVRRVAREKDFDRIRANPQFVELVNEQN